MESDDIQKMANRICQIKKVISIEDILSAGTALVPASHRMSNYSIAYSKDPAEWTAYLKRDDKLFLNPDEYDKTVIDYALEAGNYPFLKFLMDNGYIWFVGNEKKEYNVGFGAGTSIKRREIGFHDPLEYRMKARDDLRFKMISLAIRDKDLDMLNRLHAREIPMLYTLNHVMHYTLTDKKLPESSNVETMVHYIYPETGFVAFTIPMYIKHSIRGFITNIIHMTVTSSDPEVQFLIDGMNKTYDTFINYFEEKEA